MGVTKLWTVLKPAKRTIKLQSLKYRRLAIDASIWLTSFVKAMRDADGNTIHNAHLKGLWGRICKLLIFGMKPVFVFDGAPPLLKTETLIARRRARMKAEGDLQRIAERILLNQLKLSSIAQAKVLVKEGKLKLSEALQIGLTGTIPASLQLPEQNTEAAEAESKENVVVLDSSVSDLDKSQTENETRDFVSSFTSEELRNMGVDEKFVTELPNETQLALLSEMKAAHRGHVGTISLTSPKRLSGANYSNLQVEQLVQKGEISRRLEAVRGEFNAENYKPIASDPRVRYRLTSTQKTPEKPYLFKPLATASSGSTSTVIQSNSSFISSSPSSTVTRQHFIAQNELENISSSGSMRSKDHTRLAPPGLFSTANLSSQQQLIASELAFADPEIIMVDLVSDSEEEDTTSDDEDSLSDSDDASEYPAHKSPSKLVQKDLTSRRMDEMMVTDHDDEFEDIEFEDVSSSMPSDLASTPAVSASSGSFNTVPTNLDPKEKILAEGSYITSSPPSSQSQPKSSFPEPFESHISSILDTDATDFGAFGEDVEDVGASSVNSSIRSSLESIKKVEENDLNILEPSAIDFGMMEVNTSDVTEVVAVGPPRNGAPHQSVSIADSSRTMSFGNELDVSTESQRMPSVNQSFASEEGLSMHSFETLEMELQREVAMLEGEARQGQNQAATLTSEAVDEAKELLRLFGIPFVQSPSEADAQCAILQTLGLVDGIVTDDSDILVFGGDTVFRYAFSHHHELELYNMEDVKTELGLDHDGLIFLALLLGGDYAEGIKKVGPRAALDIVSEFSGPNGMYQFKAWLHAFQAGNEDYEMVLTPPSAPFVKKHKKLLQTIVLPASFPNPSVLDAYQNPTIDNSKERFEWGWPNLAGLRQFALDKFGWTKERVDTNLLPVIQIYTAALSDTQPKIETFFTHTSIHGHKPTQKTVSSKPKTKATAVSRRNRASGSSDNPSNDQSAVKPPKKRARSKPMSTPNTLPETSDTELTDVGLPPIKKIKEVEE